MEPSAVEVAVVSTSATTSRQFCTFPSAAQPDILRATRKDALYLQHFTEQCHDVVRQLLGPRRAMLWTRETKLLAELLYHGITTGTGVQTLGEEYCDILQVEGGSSVPPGVFQRGLLVFLATLGPYITERVAQTNTAGPVMHQAPSEHNAQQDVSGPSGSGREAGVEAGVKLHCQRWLRQWSTAVRRAAKWVTENASMGMKIQLALFYLFGVYYHWSKRATGVRYVFIGKLFERRLSYKLIGVVVALQLAINGGLWAAQKLMPRWHVSLFSNDATAAVQRNAVFLKDDEDVPEDDVSSIAESPVRPGSAVQPAVRCSLCLCRRDCPTATPCGHVFCWKCIAEWCCQKPECPLCRSPAECQDLVRVYHADF